ncbi:MarR family transcriptional regulator [Natronobacterium gregoryi]|uniref:MarR family transcriptional regulator n=1 Tax=Natronobacterium gregoryi (strain ATCC 43098 / DSM 3393 / CCM 3738 / CIP 104747 / IAM 13177 / JCM 8860 / NBRC 102187 / NCIMB 2189 / SP2) TaxID=797304 RepID=A0A2J4JEM5_NATGS|nr:MarR family transcriptional regulator [Natronobacterium gregoryi]PLK20361.1 MarR family transcriptional regulator [Natronobacterium gregoryi SP2]
MSLPDTSPDVDNLPPSAKYVVFALEAAGGSLSRCELQERTDLAERTLDDALDRLEAADVVRRDRAADDLRYVHVEIDEST